MSPVSIAGTVSRIRGCFNKGISDSRGMKMRMWLLFVLFACLSGALYLSFGTPEYNEKASELVSQLEDLQ
jgi:hypothetical protein